MLLDTPLCDFGWEAPNFELHDAHGKRVVMKEYLEGKSGLVIAFISNHCPYVQRIAENLAYDATQLLKENIGFLGIMSNDYEAYPDDSPSNMIEFARRFDFSFPYLIDEDQRVAKAYQAVCTPDFFGLNAQGLLQYRGRLDNTSMTKSPEERVPELRNAMQDIAKTQQGPKEQLPSMGCSIKWKV